MLLVFRIIYSQYNALRLVGYGGKSAELFARFLPSKMIYSGVHTLKEPGPCFSNFICVRFTGVCTSFLSEFPRCTEGESRAMLLSPTFSQLDGFNADVK